MAKLDIGKIPSEIVLRSIFNQDELGRIKEEYNAEKDLESWALDLRHVLSDYEDLLAKGDRAYRSKTNIYGHESYYERAQAVLGELRERHPEVDSILLIPAGTSIGDVYGSSLSPENQPRFIYSNSSYAEPIRKDKVSYRKVLKRHLKNKLKN